MTHDGDSSWGEDIIEHMQPTPHVTFQRGKNISFKNSHVMVQYEKMEKNIYHFWGEGGQDPKW